MFVIYLFWRLKHIFLLLNETWPICSLLQDLSDRLGGGEGLLERLLSLLSLQTRHVEHLDEIQTKGRTVKAADWLPAWPPAHFKSPVWFLLPFEKCLMTIVLQSDDRTGCKELNSSLGLIGILNSNIVQIFCKGTFRIFFFFNIWNRRKQVCLMNEWEFLTLLFQYHIANTFTSSCNYSISDLDICVTLFLWCLGRKNNQSVFST